MNGVAAIFDPKLLIPSKIVKDCYGILVEPKFFYSINLQWAPELRDIPDNCEADELVRLGTTLNYILVRRKYVYLWLLVDI